MPDRAWKWNRPAAPDAGAVLLLPRPPFRAVLGPRGTAGRHLRGPNVYTSCSGTPLVRSCAVTSQDLPMPDHPMPSPP